MTTIENLRDKFNYRMVDLKLVNIYSDKILKYHKYDILSGYYISLIKHDELLYVFTESSTAYKIDLNEVSKTSLSDLFYMVRPRKIIFNYSDLSKHLINFEKHKGLYDLQLVAKIILGFSASSIDELFSLFANKHLEEGIESDLFLLFDIKDIFNEFLYENKLFDLVNFEHQILILVHNMMAKGLPYNPDRFSKFVVDIEKEYSRNKLFFEKSYNSNYDDVESIFLANSNLLSINEDILLDSHDTALLEAVKTYRLKSALNNFNTAIKNDKRVFINYNTFNEYNNIDNIKLENEFAFLEDDKKVFVRGKLNNLFWNIFIICSNIDYLNDFTSKENLFLFLSKKIFNKDNTYNKVLTEAFLLGLLQGYVQPDDMISFLLYEFKISITEEKVLEIEKLFVKNVPDIIYNIENFTKERYLGRYSFSGNLKLFNYIELIKADIIKKTLVNIANNIINFNSTNKYLIELIHYQDDTFIIESDPECSNTAFDILSRVLPIEYEKFCRNNTSCSITSNDCYIIL
ncbi:MAG: hypothetical protein N4A40_12660 [Tissierellales bacterium]|jgi:hypothetical protein|nr:hypothetical protein [Tissierellales bacterium]